VVTKIVVYLHTMSHALAQMNRLKLCLERGIQGLQVAKSLLIKGIAEENLKVMNFTDC